MERKKSARRGHAESAREEENLRSIDTGEDEMMKTFTILLFFL